MKTDLTLYKKDNIMNDKKNIIIPADVPSHQEQEFSKNYQAITGKNGNLLLFAADQKIEHLNEDFFGPNIYHDSQNPEYLFKIAQENKNKIGTFASHLGLIARYAKCYPDVNYIIKLNGKTNLVSQMDPMSKMLWSVDDVIQFKKTSNLSIRGIGITLYLGSEFESSMLQAAAQSIFNAHQHGLIAILWCYMRGKEIAHKQSPELSAGAAGIAASLGSDFVKIKPPKPSKDFTYKEALELTCNAAGNTHVICAGGEKISPRQLLEDIYAQLSAGTAGCAIGRNIFQRSPEEAASLIGALSALIHDNSSIATALELLKI